MTAHIQLAFWTTLLSVTITYAWWVNVRVWILRQDLFEIRDEMWLAARNRGQLGDPVYNQTRDGINAFIRLAPWMSFVFLFKMLVDGTDTHIPDYIPPELVEVRKRVFYRIIRFLLWETLTGWLFLAATILYVSKKTMTSQMMKWISRLFDSKEIRGGCLA